MKNIEPADFMKNTNPIDKFREWFHEAQKTSLKHPEAFALSTVSQNKTSPPNARIVLMKEITAQGIIFFSNYKSHKGQELENIKKATALFYWDPLFRQVKWSGDVSKVSRAETEKYWRSRPRKSQLSQWVSQQSQPVASREQMDAEFKKAEAEFKNKDVPCPQHWGGYVICPTFIEFWIGREGRFHDRLTYQKIQEQWKGQRLYP